MQFFKELYKVNMYMCMCPVYFYLNIMHTKKAIKKIYLLIRVWKYIHDCLLLKNCAIFQRTVQSKNVYNQVNVGVNLLLQNIYVFI